MVYALRDVIGANLDRIQIVKGWLDANGKTHEKVYEAFRFGIEIPEGAQTTHQERAYTAPIWYTP